jgi:glycosyltransferase involved in cell wall biosynthesis
VQFEGRKGAATGDVRGTPPGGRIRVLLVIKVLGHGGAERLLVDMVARRDADAFDYEVAYVLAAEDGLAATVAADGTPVHALGAEGNWDLRWVARLRALLVDGRFDVVHFHLPYTASLGRLGVATLPRARRPAIVYTEHSAWDKMAVLVKALNRTTIGMDRSLIVVSEAAHQALPAALRGRARVIVHGIDLSRSHELRAERAAVRAAVREELGVPDDELLVLTVANLRPEKGYDVLLDAARTIGDRHLPVRFIAVGRGPLADELAARHRDLDLGERFRFLGERSDVIRLLVGCDVFVLPSRQEGLPVTLMEATSTGTAIVASAVGGVPQVITDGVDGLLVPPGDPGALADAVERVVTDPDLRRRLGEGAIRRSDMFDVGAASREVEGIYRGLAGVGR